MSDLPPAPTSKYPYDNIASLVETELEKYRPFCKSDREFSSRCYCVQQSPTPDENVIIYYFDGNPIFGVREWVDNWAIHFELKIMQPMLHSDNPKGE